MSPISVLMLKSLVGGPRCFGGLQLLCWGTSQVGVRAVSPLGDAQVQGTSHKSFAFGVVHACSARQVGFWYAVLVWCQQLCFPVSLHVSLLDSELACFGLPVLLVLRAAPSVTATLSGRPSIIFRSFSSAICPLAISVADGSPVLRHVQQAVQQRGPAGAVNSYVRTSASHGGTVANFSR